MPKLPYLYKAVSWAQKYGVKVLVDLHGAPGSQVSGLYHPEFHPFTETSRLDCYRMGKLTLLLK